jgi:hypothetical protein
MGGAVSVQVASMDAKALIHKTADITLDGRLIVDSAADIKYTVNADASGSKQAASTGVGAGIAVAVNGSDTFAAVQDGAKLNGNVKGVSVTALQKLEDTVSAKAGAAGGTAVVPVAAVDVTAARANAYMGKVDKNNNLKLTENAAVSARTDASHSISADASATGAGLGAAISVSVLSDKAVAKLNQSLEAGQVAVAAETISKVINQVYEPVADRNVKKIAVTTVTGWLKAAGFLCERPAPDKQGTISIPTEKGLRLGIRPEERSFNGRTYTAVIYDQSAQEYVVNCLEMIENGEVPA